LKAVYFGGSVVSPRLPADVSQAHMPINLAPQADFDAYKNSAHFKQMGEQLMPLFADAPDSRYYTADLLPST
jgi:hypothetical protein